MKADEQLLKNKHITPLEKLVLIVIANDEYEPWEQPSLLTCGEIGLALGFTRAKILDIMWGLVEKDLVESKVENKMRETRISKRLKRMMLK